MLFNWDTNKGVLWLTIAATGEVQAIPLHSVRYFMVMS